MTTTNDLIEDWVQIRSTLQKQIKMLEAGKVRRDTDIPEPAMNETLDQLKSWVHDLNKLLKEFTNANWA